MARVTKTILVARCLDADRHRWNDPQPRRTYGCGTFHQMDAGAIGATWPASLSIWGLCCLVGLAARGPTAWGTALANLFTGRAERRAALVRQVADRDRRIAELEREVLG